VRDSPMGVRYNEPESVLREGFSLGPLACLSVTRLLRPVEKPNPILPFCVYVGGGVNIPREARKHNTLVYIDIKRQKHRAWREKILGRKVFCAKREKIKEGGYIFPVSLLLKPAPCQLTTRVIPWCESTSPHQQEANLKVR
jgi:hypothetical protein